MILKKHFIKIKYKIYNKKNNNHLSFIFKLFFKESSEIKKIILSNICTYSLINFNKYSELLKKKYYSN